MSYPAFSAPPGKARQWPTWLRETPGANVLVLRAFLGVTFVVAGVQKLANPNFFKASDPTGIEATMKSAQTFSPIGGLLGPAIHVAALLGIVIALGELAVGLGTLAGFMSRTAARAGMLLSLMFFLTVSWSTTPYYYGADIVFLFAWTPFALSGAGAFSFDSWFHSRKQAALTDAAPQSADAVKRRFAMRKIGLAASLAGFVAVFAGMSSAVGRLVAGSNDASASSDTIPGGSTGPTTTTASGGTGKPTSTTTAGGTPKGKFIGPASAVAVGNAEPFQAGAVPAYVLQPAAEEFVAFSRICTHEGCTVNYVHAVQQFQCPCHGSVYDADTGAVISGPAPLPLPKIPVVKASNGGLYATE